MVFGVVRNLAVPVVLDPLITDRFLKDIFRPERRIALYNSKSISIMNTNDLL